MEYISVEDIDLSKEKVAEVTIYTTEDGFVVDIKDKYGNLIEGRILERRSVESYGK